jgi:hypothetical protein
LVRDGAPELRLVHNWLDSWSGLGLIIAGMTHQGWDVQLTAYAARDWRANFFPVEIAHSIVGGTAWEPTPRRAVQRAAVKSTACCPMRAAQPGSLALHYTALTGGRSATR